MAIQLSPSVLVQETDLTNVITAVSASTGAAVIDATWGPVMTVTTVDSENSLVSQFGRPQTNNAADWFTAANFLGYTDNLKLVRTDTYGQKNAVATLASTLSSIPVTSGGAGYTTDVTVAIPAPTVSLANGGVQATAEAVLNSGTITSIRITNPGAGYTTAPTVTVTGTNTTPAVIGAVITTSSGIKINNQDHYETVFSTKSASVIGMFAAKYPGVIGNSISVSMADAASWASWAYKSYFTSAPGTSVVAAGAGSTGDEVHVVVIDTNGKWTGTAGAVLETYPFLSKASDAKAEDGTSAYYKNVLNARSRYVWWMGHLSASNWGTATSTAATFTSIGSSAMTVTLSGGSDDLASNDSIKQNAFALFDNDEQFDISLVIGGKTTANTARFVIQNVAEKRKDCVAFISPVDATTNEPIIGSLPALTDKLIEFKNSTSVGVNVSSSYAFFDSGYKYQYDRYNDVYRWIPLCGDVAGLCARTDATNDPWWSPAGLNRGQIKNVVKLAFNPRKTDRDNLYQAGINPVVSFPGQGVVLYGDKTALAKPSAFDRINVRRLFITLEKAIATAAKFQLFQFNDTFTRAQFKNMVEPYLRDVQGRRGITEFKVVCDDTNNTGEVIDGNRFVADIYIKPQRQVNFITLNFIATRTSASFSEIAGV